MQPGKKQLTPDEIIADTKRGIYVEGRGSWSIDHQRYNFQFGGQQFTLIENGKLTKPLRYVAYQSNSVEFWRSLDALADARDYFVGGALNDGKGEPEQVEPGVARLRDLALPRHPRHQREEGVMERPLDEQTARAAVKAAFDAVTADDVRVNIDAERARLHPLRGQRSDDLGQGDRRGDVGDLRASAAKHGTRDHPRRARRRRRRRGPARARAGARRARRSRVRAVARRRRR